MGAQWTLTYFQTFLPEAVMSPPSTVLGDPGHTSPFCEKDQGRGQGSLGVGLAVSFMGKEWKDIWWVCSAHSVPGWVLF